LKTAAWARANNNAAGLALASRMLAAVPTRDMGKVDKSSEQTEEGKASAEKPRKDVTPESLMAEAKAMAGEDKDMLAAVETIGKSSVVAARSAVGGAITHYDSVNAHTNDWYTIWFRAGELAEVAVNGDGDTDLDLYVYDENGHLIVSDTDATDQCYVRWTPAWTGQFRIKIANLGSVYNNYVLRTN
jgi:hypothetical protein